jgi:5-enolpyruvylshikimate-3-phosphate synthase
MAFLVAGLRCRDGVAITDPGRIETSDPGFPDTLNRILTEEA